MPLVQYKQSVLRGNLIVVTSAQESIVWAEHTLGLVQAVRVAWQSECVCTSAQESIVWGEHTLGLAHAILVAWQCHCAACCKGIDCRVHGDARLGQRLVCLAQRAASRGHGRKMAAGQGTRIWKCMKKPPVGFEPTTSRLLSGCSAN